MKLKNQQNNKIKLKAQSSGKNEFIKAGNMRVNRNVCFCDFMKVFTKYENRTYDPVLACVM